MKNIYFSSPTVSAQQVHSLPFLFFFLFQPAQLHLPGPNRQPGPLRLPLSPLHCRAGPTRMGLPLPRVRRGLCRVRPHPAPPLCALARTPRRSPPAYKRRRPHPVNPSNRAAAATPSRNPSSRAAIVAELGAHRRAAVPSLPHLQKLPPEHRVVVRTLTGPFSLSLTLSFARDSSPSPPFRHASPQALPRPL